MPVDKFSQHAIVLHYKYIRSQQGDEYQKNGFTTVRSEIQLQIFCYGPFILNKTKCNVKLPAPSPLTDLRFV